MARAVVLLLLAEQVPPLVEQDLSPTKQDLGDDGPVGLTEARPRAGLGLAPQGLLELVRVEARQGEDPVEVEETRRVIRDRHETVGM